MNTITRGLRQIARSCLESGPCAPVRSAVVAQEARAEAGFVRQLARQARVHIFEPESFQEKLKAKPKSDTFFILGSGSSINDLASGHFEEMSQSHTVGINNWGLHPFVPDIYSLDSVPWVGDGENFRRSLDLLHRPDIIAAQPQLLIVRLKSAVERQHLETLPEELKDGVHFYGRVTPATREVRNLEGDLSRALKILQVQHPSVVVDSGASIVRMVGVALALGHVRIVLVGVDLNNTAYFWENNPFYDSSQVINTPVNNQKTGSHETTSMWIRPFSVVDMLGSLRDTVSKEFGVDILVASPKSELANVLPVYTWPGPVRTA